MMIYQGYDLKDLNSFHISAKASFFMEASGVDDLREATAFAKGKSIPILVLGGGSNILFTRDFDGLAIRIRIEGFEKVSEDEEHVFIRIGAGEDWHRTVVRCVDLGYGGIENLSLIPGTAGAAPIQNIGAYGVEFKDVFDSLEAFDIETGHIKKFTLEDCKFGYRSSIFKNEYKGRFIIVNIILKLTKKPSFNISYNALQSAMRTSGIRTLSLKGISDMIIAIRQSKLPDPKLIGNAGSFFKNPVVSEGRLRKMALSFPGIAGRSDGQGNIKLSAAWLIEQCGWKGKRLGNIGVYENHALILVNYGGGQGSDIKKLSEQIQESVASRFGIHLEPEVNIL